MDVNVESPSQEELLLEEVDEHIASCLQILQKLIEDSDVMCEFHTRTARILFSKLMELKKKQLLAETKRARLRAIRDLLRFHLSGAKIGKYKNKAHAVVNKPKNIEITQRAYYKALRGDEVL